MQKIDKVYLLEDRKTVDIVFDENHLIIRDSSNILHNIPIENIEQLGIREITSPTPTIESTNWIAYLPPLKRKPRDTGPALAVTYAGKAGKNSITLVTGKAAELARKIESLRATAPRTVPVPPSTASSVKPAEEKKYCRYCGVENKNDAVFCEKCGKKIG